MFIGRYRCVSLALPLVLAGALVVAVACSTSPGGLSTPDGAVACRSGLPALPSSELPVGKPCAVDSATCQIDVEGVCGDADNASIVNGWTCACKNETWQCAITSYGGGDCPPNFGPYCGLKPPTYGLSEACYSCCLGPDYLVGCSQYSMCYCACDPKDASCLSKCGPFSLDSTCAPQFTQLAQCIKGKCASECSGESLPDAGTTREASTEAHADDAPNEGNGG